MKNRSPAVPDPSVPFARGLFRLDGFRIRTAALIASAAIGVCTAVRLDAVVIDDFEDGVKFLPGGGGLDYLQASVTNGQMVWSGQFPGPFDPVRSTVNYDQVYWSTSLPTVSLQGRTLEVRMDLVNVGADDVILSFGAGGPAGGRDSWYYIAMDQNEIGLVKGMYDVGTTLCFYTAAAITNRDATVSLAFTLTGDTLRLTTKVVAKSTGQVLFEKSFTDGPGSDCSVPVPPPKGLPYYRADWGAPLTNLTYVWVGVSDTRTTLPRPPALEMVLDNLEYDLYDAPSLQIERSVLLSFSADTLEEQIVLGADSIEGPWRPWPAPIYKQSGRWSMAVPITDSNAQHWLQPQLYFKLAPGTQFIDSFDPAKPPYASRASWVPGFYALVDTSRWEITDTNGVLRFHTLQTPVDGRVAMPPPGPCPAVADFWASVDILHLDVSLHGKGLAIGARSTWRVGDEVPGNGRGYLGGVLPHAAGTNRARLTVYNSSSAIDGEVFTFKPGTPYRLIFSGIGQRLSVKFIDLNTGQPAVKTHEVTDSTFSQGPVGLWIEAGQGMYDATLDNFFVTGTKPASP